jgi:transposase-like protein
MARFSEEKRKEAVQRVADGEKPGDVARKLGITPVTLEKWMGESVGRDGKENPEALPAPTSPLTMSEERALAADASRPNPGKLPELVEFDAVSAIIRTLHTVPATSRRRVLKAVTDLLETLWSSSTPAVRTIAMGIPNGPPAPTTAESAAG